MHTVSHVAASHAGGDVVRLNDLVVAAGEEAMLRACGLDSLDALFAARGAASLDKPGLASWRTRERIELDDGAPAAGADGALGTHPTAGGAPLVTLYLKRYSNPPVAARRAVLRSDHDARSLAGVEWNLMRQLRERGIPCPVGVALGEEFRAGREVRSAVLARAVPGRSLERLLAEPGALDRGTLRSVLQATARLVAKFHGCGWVHRDLYLAHLFFDPTAVPEQGLHIIDLQRVIRPRCCLNRWIVKDLASLNYSAPRGVISRSDRVRWLRTYLDAARLGVAGRVLAFRVVGKTQQIARHDHRRTLRLTGYGGNAR